MYNSVSEERRQYEQEPTMNAINHPGMTAQWFDQAVNRAICNGCRVIETGKPGVLFVTSGSSNLVYKTTRETCTCRGGREFGRCLHRALVIFTVDVIGQDSFGKDAA
jgi:hypothetical protein